MDGLTFNITQRVNYNILYNSCNLHSIHDIKQTASALFYNIILRNEEERNWNHITISTEKFLQEQMLNRSNVMDGVINEKAQRVVIHVWSSIQLRKLHKSDQSERSRILNVTCAWFCR